MISLFKRGMNWMTGAFTAILTLVPEASFGHYHWAITDLMESFSCINCLLTNEELDTIIGKLLILLLVFSGCVILLFLISYFRESKTIKVGNSIIKVEYGDIMKVKDCLRVINFDECFTTKVGSEKGDIRPTSICGQYLLANKNIDMQSLIRNAQVTPEKTKSQFKKKERFKSGVIVPNGKDLLMAFAKLDKEGRGMFPTIDDYRECLSTMWNEIDIHNQQCDVCIPILGSGLARMDYTQQELLDMIIWSYKMTSRKLLQPYKLRIICKRNSGFSLDNIKQ